jgi:hypothetical protein
MVIHGRNIPKPITLGSERRHYFDDVGCGCLLDDCALKEERWTDCESRQTDQVCVFENCVGRRTNRCRRGYEPESSSSSRFFQLTPRLK